MRPEARGICHMVNPTLSPKPLAGFKGPISKGRGGRTEGKDKRGGMEGRGPTSKVRGEGMVSPQTKNQTLPVDTSDILSGTE